MILEDFVVEGSWSIFCSRHFDGGIGYKKSRKEELFGMERVGEDEKYRNRKTMEVCLCGEFIDFFSSDIGMRWGGG
jgi:hypothetical protein